MLVTFICWFTTKWKTTITNLQKARMKNKKNVSCASLDCITGVQSWCEISMRNFSIFTEFIERKVDLCLLMFTLDEDTTVNTRKWSVILVSNTPMAFLDNKSLLKMLSIKVANLSLVGLVMLGRSEYEYIMSTNSLVRVWLSVFSKLRL